MSGLFEKDLRIILKRKMTLVIFAILALGIGISMGGVFIVGYLSLLLGILAIGTETYDEMDDGFTFLMTMPVSAKTYVIEKYLFSGAGILCGWVIGVGVSAISPLFNPESDAFSFGAEQLAILATMTCMMSIVLALQIKFGAEKSRLIYIILFGAVAAVVFFMVKVLPEERHAIMEAQLGNVSEGIVLVTACILMLVSLLICIPASIKAVKGKLN